MGFEAIKTEHAGAKNGGGHWGTRADAKTISNHARRVADRDEADRQLRDEERPPSAR